MAVAHADISIEMSMPIRQMHDNFRSHVKNEDTVALLGTASFLAPHMACDKLKIRQQ